MRLMEGLRLRVKDVDFERNQIVVHDGKGMKDRVVMLPDKLRQELQRHLERVKLLQERDLAEGLGSVALAVCAESEISPCGAGMGVAMVLARTDDFSGSKGQAAQAASHQRHECAAGDARSGETSADYKTGDMPHAAAFIRHASVGEWL